MKEVQFAETIGPPKSLQHQEVQKQWQAIISMALNSDAP